MVHNFKKSAGLVIFNHGRDSHPWATKITRLAKIAKAKGFTVESLDYTGVLDPDRRVQMLLDQANPDKHPLILVGSSMGGYVATVASEKLRPDGLFLMAPALYMEDYPVQDPHPCSELIFIIHGWSDELIPAEHSIRFARRHQAHLLLVESDHRLIDQLETIAWHFIWFLDQFKFHQEQRIL